MTDSFWTYSSQRAGSERVVLEQKCGVRIIGSSETGRGQIVSLTDRFNLTTKTSSTVF